MVEGQNSLKVQVDYTKSGVLYANFHIVASKIWRCIL